MLRSPLQYYTQVFFIMVQATKGSENNIKVDQTDRKPYLCGIKKKKKLQIWCLLAQKEVMDAILKQRKYIDKVKNIFFYLLESELMQPKLPKIFD